MTHVFANMLNQVTDYLKHRIRCKSIYSVHSPFVFDWHQHVLKASRSSIGADIDKLRKKLSHDSRLISLRDYGAGTGNNPPKKQERRLGELVSKASRKRASGELLYHICKHYQPNRCLEFGTHVGISSLYQSKALSNSQFVTMEGDPALAEIASENFNRFDVNIRQAIGEFGRLLEQEVDLKKFRPDYVFIDGNHRYKPTMQYFHQLLPHLPDESILIFDDIYWSKEMKKAWAEIVSHPEVTVSIDVYFLGICFIRRKQAKEHFTFKL